MKKIINLIRVFFWLNKGLIKIKRHPVMTDVVQTFNFLCSLLPDKNTNHGLPFPANVTLLTPVFVLLFVIKDSSTLFNIVHCLDDKIVQEVSKSVKVKTYTQFKFAQSHIQDPLLAQLWIVFQSSCCFCFLFLSEGFWPPPLFRSFPQKHLDIRERLDWLPDWKHNIVQVHGVIYWI